MNGLSTTRIFISDSNRKLGLHQVASLCGVEQWNREVLVARILSWLLIIWSIDYYFRLSSFTNYLIFPYFSSWYYGFDAVWIYYCLFLLTFLPLDLSSPFSYEHNFLSLRFEDRAGMFLRLHLLFIAHDALAGNLYLSYLFFTRLIVLSASVSSSLSTVPPLPTHV